MVGDDGSDDRRMITTAEVAERCAVSVVTVERWRFDGYGPRPYRFGGTIVRYDRSEVDRWIDEQRS